MQILREGTPLQAPLPCRLDRLRVVTVATMQTVGPSRELNTIIMQLRPITIMEETSDKAVVVWSMQEVLAAPTLEFLLATLNFSPNN